MEEKNHFDKLEQLRADVQAGIASGNAGTLDANKIKQRGRARHAYILREIRHQDDGPKPRPTNEALTSLVSTRTANENEEDTATDG